MKPRTHPRGTIAAYIRHLDETVALDDLGAEAWRAAIERGCKPRPFGSWLYSASRDLFGAQLQYDLGEGLWSFEPPAKQGRQKPVVSRRAEQKAATLEKAYAAAEIRQRPATLEQVGVEMGVTRERARQLCAMVLGDWRPRLERPQSASRASKCRRPGCRRRSLAFCLPCRRIAERRGVDPADLPPIGDLPHDWSGWVGSEAQRRARRENVKKAIAGRRAKCAERKSK